MDTPIANLMGMAATAELGGNREEAISYFNRVLEADPTFSEAWLGKGRCAGQLSSVEKMRVREAFVAFGHAIATASDGAKESTSRRAFAELLAIVQAQYVLARHTASDRSLRGFALGAGVTMIELIRDAQSWDPENSAAPSQIAMMCREMLALGPTGEGAVQLRAWLPEAEARLRALDPGIAAAEEARACADRERAILDARDGRGIWLVLACLVALLVVIEIITH